MVKAGGAKYRPKNHAKCRLQLKSPRDLLFNVFADRRAFGCMSWHDLDRRFPATARPGASQPDGKEVVLQVWLADAFVGNPNNLWRARVTSRENLPPIASRQCWNG